MKLCGDALYIQNYLGHIFLDTGNSGYFMENAIDFDADNCNTGKRAKQYTTQRIAESGTITALQGLDNELTALTVFAQINGCNIRLLYFYHTITLLVNINTALKSYWVYRRLLLFGIQFNYELFLYGEVEVFALHLRNYLGNSVFFVNLKPLGSDSGLAEFC